MDTTLDRPADTQLMSVVHSALRRDLERTRIVLGSDAVPAVRRRALAAHLQWLVRFLHHHHDAEDTGLFPTALAKDPALADLLDLMDEEHHAIHAAMGEVESAARARADSDDARPRLVAALAALTAVVVPHLEHEEEELMPRVARAVTQREWLAWDQETNIKPKKPAQLAFEGHWLIDHVTPDVRAKVVSMVPPVPRFVLIHLLGGRYRRTRAAMWAGTPAAAVPSLTVEAQRSLSG